MSASARQVEDQRALRDGRCRSRAAARIEIEAGALLSMEAAPMRTPRTTRVGRSTTRIGCVAHLRRLERLVDAIRRRPTSARSSDRRCEETVGDATR